MAVIAMASTSPVLLDRYVIDALMRDLVGHDKSPSAFIVYLAIEAEAQKGRALLSHTDLSELTGLSKRACQNAVALLDRRGLIEITRSRSTDPAQFRPTRPWARV
ncbi:MAG TPA: helix-turn-helix domain-containing protein [Sphingomicrobium sp.]|nr:helix-turn-helix domain-containing protein [Sphingomicrobium sp.]